MAFSTLRLAFCSLLAISCGLASATDLKIVTTIRSGAPDSPQSTNTRYFHDSRSRTDSRNWGGHFAHPGDKIVYTWGPRQAFIQQCDAHRFLMLNLDSREYTATDLDEHGVAEGAKPLAAARQESARGSYEIFRDGVDTGERQEMFGRTARHIITRERRVATPEGCEHSSSSETDGWYIDLEVPSAACSPRPKSGKSVSVLVSGPASCLQKLEVHRTGVTETGFPVKFTVTTHSTLPLADGTQKEFANTSEYEVTEISEAPLDPALFEIPAGFKQVPRLNTQPPVPTMLAIRQWWQRLKRSVWIFG